MLTMKKRQIDELECHDAVVPFYVRRVRIDKQLRITPYGLLLCVFVEPLSMGSSVIIHILFKRLDNFYAY